MSYTPTNWQTGDTVTAEKLNKMETGIANASIDGRLVTMEVNGDTIVDVDATASEVRSEVLNGKNVIIKLVNYTNHTTMAFLYLYQIFNENYVYFRADATISFPKHYSVSIQYDSWVYMDSIMYPDANSAMAITVGHESDYHNQALIFNAIDEYWYPSSIEHYYDFDDALVQLVNAAWQYAASQRTTLCAQFIDQDTAGAIYEIAEKTYDSMDDGRGTVCKYAVDYSGGTLIARITSCNFSNPETGVTVYQASSSGNLPVNTTFTSGTLQGVTCFPFSMVFYAKKTEVEDADPEYYALVTVTVDKDVAVIVS